MTPNQIFIAVNRAFRSLYPTANVVVRGAGEEEMQVSVQHGTQYIQTFVCDVPSDDDGLFRFYQVDRDTQLEDAVCHVAIPYPEES